MKLVVNNETKISRNDPRRTLTEKALKIYPHLADAWIILAEETATTQEAALEFYKKALEAGEMNLGKEFFKENIGHFWGMIEARPYMRAKVYLAQALWDLGSENEAIEHSKTVCDSIQTIIKESVIF